MLFSPYHRNRYVLFLVLLVSSVTTCAAPASVNLNYQVINNFPVKFVRINLNDPEVLVTAVVSRTFPTGLESWSSFINRVKPDAAINGTYFSPDTRQPVGGVALDGALVYRGSVGTALCITPDNRAVFLPGSKLDSNTWNGYRTVMQAGPRLLTDTRLTINPRAEGFRDPRVLGSAPRSAVALRKDGQLLLLTVRKNISLRNLAWVCQKLGAVHAMALDGGTSSGLYADRRTVTRPGRSISNILAVYATPARYRAVAQQFMPREKLILARLLPQLTGPFTPPSVLPTPPAPPPVAETPVKETVTTPESLVRITAPDTQQPARGTVPVTIRYAEDQRIAWCSLRINGELRAMSNQRSMVFQWESTKESDGVYTLEAAVWTQDNALIAMDTRQIIVQNHSELAEN